MSTNDQGCSTALSTNFQVSFPRVFSLFLSSPLPHAHCPISPDLTIFNSCRDTDSFFQAKGRSLVIRASSSAQIPECTHYLDPVPTALVLQSASHSPQLQSKHLEHVSRETQLGIWGIWPAPGQQWNFSTFSSFILAAGLQILIVFHWL